MKLLVTQEEFEEWEDNLNRILKETNLSNVVTVQFLPEQLIIFGSRV